MNKQVKYKKHVIIVDQGPLGEWVVHVVDEDKIELLYDDWDDSEARAIRRGKHWIDKQEQINKEKKYYKRFLK